MRGSSSNPAPRRPSPVVLDTEKPDHKTTTTNDDMSPSKKRLLDRLHYLEAFAQAFASSDLFFCISSARWVGPDHTVVSSMASGVAAVSSGGRAELASSATKAEPSCCEDVRHTSCWNPKRGLQQPRNGRQRWNLFWRVCAVWRSRSRQSSRRVETGQGYEEGFACKGFLSRARAHLSELDAKRAVVNATFRKPHRGWMH